MKSFLFSCLTPCGFVLTLFWAIPLAAQWEPDVRLTFNDSASYTNNNNAWCVSSSSDSVHVVWCDERDGNREIYYKGSADGGRTWGGDVRLTHDSASSGSSSITVKGFYLHVVWQDERDKYYYPEIYYKRSTDGGLMWEPDIRLTNDTARSVNPSISGAGSNVHVVWADERDGAFNYEIYYKRSSDAGASWGPDIRQSNDPSYSFFPSIAASGSNVHIAWDDQRDGNDEIYYRGSTDEGISWGPEIRLTNDPYFSYTPSIGASGSNVYVVWSDGRNSSNGEIYFKRSTDAGASWWPDVRLTNDPAYSADPNIVVSGPNIHMVWGDRRDGTYEIYYKRSTDGGASWGPDTSLTVDPATSEHPSVSSSGSNIHVVWSDNRSGNIEIFYKRNPTGNSGIEKFVERWGGSTIGKQKVIPNPFVSFAKIPGLEGERFSLYDISGRLAGTYKGNRIGADLFPGVYFVKEMTRAPFIQRIVKLR